MLQIWYRCLVRDDFAFPQYVLEFDDSIGLSSRPFSVLHSGPFGQKANHHSDKSELRLWFIWRLEMTSFCDSCVGT
jgi:hypothetical protein